MTCINKSAAARNTTEQRDVKREGRGQLYAYVRLRSFPACSLASSMNFVHPLSLALRAHLSLTVSRWQLSPNDPSIFRYVKSVISQVELFLRVVPLRTIPVIAVIFMCSLLASKVIGGNELHWNAQVYIRARFPWKRRRELPCAYSACAKNSQTLKVSNLSPTCSRSPCASSREIRSLARRSAWNSW